MNAVASKHDLFGLWAVFQDEDAKRPSSFVRIPIVAWIVNSSGPATPVPAFRVPDYSVFGALEVTRGGAVLCKHEHYLDADQWFAEYQMVERNCFWGAFE